LRLLLDTHALFWSVDEPARVSVSAMTAMQDPANDRLLSAATIWELAIKVGLAKLTLSLLYRQWMEDQELRHRQGLELFQARRQTNITPFGFLHCPRKTKGFSTGGQLNPAERLAGTR
jgi:PIN domain nuclease of toxin-antitoxin system